MPGQGRRPAARSACGHSSTGLERKKSITSQVIPGCPRSITSYIPIFALLRNTHASSPSPYAWHSAEANPFDDPRDAGPAGGLEEEGKKEGRAERHRGRPKGSHIKQPRKRQLSEVAKWKHATPKPS